MAAEKGKEKVSDVAVKIFELLGEQPRLTCLEAAEKLGYGIQDKELDAAMAVLESSDIIHGLTVYKIVK